jgi:tetratricopeptide (TPR) repeat protein
MRGRGLWVAVLAAATVAGCRGPGSAPAGGGSAPPVEGPVQDARRAIEAGQPDAALAALQSSPPGAESSYLQGLAWAKKAESAPLPVPAGPSLPPPEWKEDERNAISCFEQAIAADPALGPAHQALADLLAPHALRHLPAASASSARSRKPRGGEPPPPSAAASDLDASPDRVIAEYRLAAQADAKDKAPVELLIAFAVRAGRPADVSAAYQELLKRDRENAAPFVRYGDFLREQKDWDGAVAQYSQALMWKPDDNDTRAKIADIYIGLGEEYLGRQQYAAAEQRFRDAQKWVKDKNSPVGQRLQAAFGQLAQIRR